MKKWLYKNYRASSSVKYWFRRRFTPGGKLILFALVFFAAVGVDTNLAMAYQGFALVFCLLAVSGLWALWPAPSLEMERVLPRYGTAGTKLHYRVYLTPAGRAPLRDLTLVEDFGDPRPTLREFLETPEPGEGNRNIFDRTFVYYRWNWLISLRQIAEAPEKEVALAPPGARTEIAMEITPTRRGVLRFEKIRAAFPDPFGIFRSFASAASPASVLVLPKRYPLPDFDLPGFSQFQKGGVALAASVGESEDFVSLRDYRRGDPPRQIHWKSLGKTGKLIVKEYQDEYFVRHALILDTFSASPDPELFEEAVSVAASFAFSIQTQDSLLDLMFVGPNAYCFTAGRGVGQAEQLLEILASVRVCTDKPFSSLENLVVEHAPVMSGCIVVLLDWDEARRELVRKIRVLGVPLLVLLLAPGEGEAPDPGPLRDAPQCFRVLRKGRVGEGLAAL